MDMFTLDKFEIKLSVLLIVSLSMTGFQSDLYYTRDYILVNMQLHKCLKLKMVLHPNLTLIILVTTQIIEHIINIPATLFIQYNIFSKPQRLPPVNYKC